MSYTVTVTGWNEDNEPVEDAATVAASSEDAAIVAVIALARTRYGLVSVGDVKVTS